VSRLVLEYDKEILSFAAIVRGLVPAHSKYPAIFSRASSSMTDIKKSLRGTDETEERWYSLNKRKSELNNLGSRRAVKSSPI